MGIEALQAEFDRRRSEFLADHESEWALLFSNGDVQFFAEEMDAVHAGFDDRRGLAFTVKQVVPVDLPVHLISVALSDQL